MFAERSVNAQVLLRSVVFALPLLFSVAGCQQRPTTVSGTITLDGKQLAVASDTRGTVVFSPDGGHGTVATGLLDSTGHFDLATGSSRVVAPGAYYVTVSVVQLLPKSEEGEQGSQLVTPAKYASARESGLAATVSAGENHLDFNLLSDVSASSSPSAEKSKSDDSEPSGAPPAKESPDKNG